MNHLQLLKSPHPATEARRLRLQKIECKGTTRPILLWGNSHAIPALEKLCQDNNAPRPCKAQLPMINLKNPLLLSFSPASALCFVAR